MSAEHSADNSCEEMMHWLKQSKFGRFSNVSIRKHVLMFVFLFYFKDSNALDVNAIHAMLDGKSYDVNQHAGQDLSKGELNYSVIVIF